MAIFCVLPIPGSHDVHALGTITSLPSSSAIRRWDSFEETDIERIDTWFVDIA